MFGPATDKGARDLQRRARLVDDGIVGPATRKVIAAAVTSVIVYLAGRYGVELDADLTATLTGLVTLG